MHIRCSYCNQSFNLSREFVVEALSETQEKGQKYYGVECINCRKLIKVPVKQLQHFAGPLADESDEAEAASA